MYGVVSKQFTKPNLYTEEHKLQSHPESFSHSSVALQSAQGRWPP
jgi:hypothetical protein